MTRESEALIIQNLSMLEDVYSVYVENIGPTVCSKIEELVGEHVSRCGFESEFNLWEEDTICFGPVEWKELQHEANDDWIAKYSFIIMHNNKEVVFDKVESTHYWLSILLGISPIQPGFSFFIDHKSLGVPKAGLWKNQLQNHDSHDKLRKIGFNLLSDCKWFLPWRLEANLLSDAYSKDNFEMNDSLKPIQDALDKIDLAHPIFMKLVSDVITNINVQK